MSEASSAKQLVFGAEPAKRRSWLRGMWRGARHKCPSCGEGRLFAGYVRTSPECAACSLDVSGHRADDAPPYLTIMVVGHVMIPAALAVKQIFDPPLATQFLIFAPLMIIATFWLLPIVKGALIGLQWANAMHGFGEGDPDAVEDWSAA